MKNDMQAFLNKIETDVDFKNELNKVLAGYSLEKLVCELSLEEQTEFLNHAVVPFAQKHGFDFTVDDIVLGENGISDFEKLSDDIINKISGGLNLKVASCAMLSAHIISLMLPFNAFAANNSKDVQASLATALSAEAGEKQEKYSDLIDILKNFKNIEAISDECPFNEVDGMIFASLSYLPMTFLPKLGESGLQKDITLKQWYDSVLDFSKKSSAESAESLEDGRILKQYVQSYDKKIGFKSDFYGKKMILLSYMAQCPRYQNIKVGNFCGKYIDIKEESPEQFAAVTFTLENGMKIVAFRGTDGTLAGWKEDLDFSWSSNVPAQKDALEYLRKINKIYPGSSFVVTGHSKGGNLAQYSAFKLSNEDSSFESRLIEILNYDGPGLRSDIVQSLNQKVFDAVSAKLTSIIPPLSIIGRIMSDTSKGKFLCAFSSAPNAMRQHDCFSWQISDEYFKKSSQKFRSYSIKTESDLSEEVVGSFLEVLDKDSMQIFSSWLFGFLTENNLGFNSLMDVKGTLKMLFNSYFIKGKSFSEIVKSVLAPGKTMSLTDEQQKSFMSVMKSIFNSALKVYWSKYSVVNDLVGISPDLGQAVFEMRNSHYELSKIGKVIAIVSSKIFKMENIVKFIKKLYS